MVPTDMSKFKVKKYTYHVEDIEPDIEELENPGVLLYHSPDFCSEAEVVIPRLEENQKVQIGYIQTCYEMKCVNEYGRKGASSWEFPELALGRVEQLNDAPRHSRKGPFYNTNTGLKTIRGPTKDKLIAKVFVHDCFHPRVTWNITDDRFDNKARLTYVYRLQKFYTYLVPHLSAVH